MQIITIKQYLYAYVYIYIYILYIYIYTHIIHIYIYRAPRWRPPQARPAVGDGKPFLDYGQFSN